MLKLIRTSNDNPDFKFLVQDLDNELTDRFGEKQSAYNQYNILDLLHTAVLVYDDGVPAGCACFKKFDEHSVEVKRMFVSPQHRGKHIAGMMLAELESWAKELNYSHAILETGTLLHEAIAMYKKAGYEQTEKYGQYVNMEASVCFRKAL
jgi:putative acetyltransferase